MAFARILVRDPHVVILDEATARLDPVTEARVQRATERLLRDRIGIVIAHRLSSVRRCDEVVVLADGAVVEAGPLRESRALRRAAGDQPRGRVRRRAGCAERRRTGGGDGLAGRHRDRRTLADRQPRRAGAGRRAEPACRPKADPPPLPPAAAGPHAAGDLPARHQRSAVRAGRGRPVPRDGAARPGRLGAAVAVGRPGRRRRRPVSGRRSGIVAALLVTAADAVLHRRAGSRSGGSGRCCGSACAWCTGRPGRAGSARTPRPRWWRRAATPSGWWSLADNLIDQFICAGHRWSP